MSIVENLKSGLAGALLGGVIAGSVAFTGGYVWGSGDLSDMKTRLANQQVKVVTVEKVVKEIAQQDRLVYQDKVKVVTQELPVLVDRPVYKNVCLDDDGVAMFNVLIGR